MQSPSKPHTFLHRHGKCNSHIHLKTKQNRKAKTILYNKRTSGVPGIPDLKQYYRAIGIQTAWYWCRDREADQWYKIEDPEIKPHT